MWWNELELDEWFDFVRSVFSRSTHMHKPRTDINLRKKKTQKEIIAEKKKPKPASMKETEESRSAVSHSALFFMLESCLGESESNRHHPAVNHNYTSLYLARWFFFFFLQRYETWWINAVFSFLLTDRRKIIVLESLRTRSWSQRSPTHLKGVKKYLFC